MRCLPRSALAVLGLVGCGDDVGASDAGIDAAWDGQITACTPAPGWIAAPSLARGPTQETATVALAGKVYVVGGFDDAFGVLDTVQVFDTQTCAWSAGPALPRAVHHANVAVHADTIWLLGAMETVNFTAVGHVWSWNPASETAWQMHPAMPAGQERGAAVTATIGDRIYLAGGLRGGSVAQVSAFDPTTQTWETTLPILPMVRDHGCGGAVGGTLYVTGGRAAALQSQVYAYAPGGTWELKAPRAGLRAAWMASASSSSVVKAMTRSRAACSRTSSRTHRRRTRGPSTRRCARRVTAWARRCGTARSTSPVVQRWRRSAPSTRTRS
jgi:hypothetical protein